MRRNDAKVTARAEILLNANPGLSQRAARDRAHDEVQMIDNVGTVDPSTRSGRLHHAAVAKLHHHPGMSYRDAVFAAARELSKAGQLPPHPSGAA